MATKKFKTNSSPFDYTPESRAVEPPEQCPELIGPSKPIPYGEVSSYGFLVGGQESDHLAPVNGEQIPVLRGSRIDKIRGRLEPKPTGKSQASEADAARKAFLKQHMPDGGLTPLRRRKSAARHTLLVADSYTVAPLGDVFNGTGRSVLLGPVASQPHVYVEGPIQFSRQEMTIRAIETTLLQASVTQVAPVSTVKAAVADKEEK